MALILTDPPQVTRAALERWWHGVDLWLLASALTLIGLGLILGFATSPPLASRNDLHPFYYVERQAVFATVAVVAMFGLSMLRLVEVRRFGVILFGAAIALLVLVLIIGDVRNGAQRWISLGLFSLQPSEIVKPGLIAATAWFFSLRDDPAAPPGRLLAFGAIALTAALLVLQPDIGQTALLCATWAGMFFLAGASLAWAASGALIVIGGGLIAYSASPYVADRLALLFNLEGRGGFQVERALAAIREGGLFGAGAGEGIWRLRLPDAHSDYVIAAAAEEYGLVLVLGVIAIYALITLRGLLIAAHLRDGFARLAVAGISALIGLQAFIHFGVAARMLPPTGMTLPLVSYGGSSLLAMGICFGILLALTRSDMERI